MQPMMARLAGAGSVLALALGITVTTHQQRAEAQSPICFTVTGGDCYCIDFFFTKVKEQVISQGQQYINNMMGEYDELKSVGIQEVLGADVGNIHTYRGYIDDGYRSALSQSARDRGLPTGQCIPKATRNAMERDPEGNTLVGRQARAIATADRDPEGLAPYRADLSGKTALASDEVQDWTDRMVLEPWDLRIPDDEGLSRLGMHDLMELYNDARHYLAANYARHHLQELAASERRLQALEGSRDRLDVGDQIDQPGAAAAANLVAKTVNLAIDAETLESQLRKESLMAALVAMRIGGAYDIQED